MTKEELLKIAKPILFNTEMVQAILEGRKSVTRRITKPQPTHHYYEDCSSVDWIDTGGNNWACKNCGGEIAPFTGKSRIRAPYQEGDILYVRETWQEVFETEYGRDRPFNIRELITNFDEIDKIKAGLSTQCSRPSDPAREKYYVFKASDIRYADSEDCLRWKPSIHMPKELARIFLKVTDVRIERLQDITIKGIEKEGYPHEIDFSYTPIATQGIMFEWWVNTWNSTIKKQDLDIYGWKANPWVWVIEFELIKRVRG